MELKRLDEALTVCKLASLEDFDLKEELYFLGKSPGEISLVCATAVAPEKTLAREDGWRGFRVQGVLDFSLVGILAKLSAILAENGISIFAVSTYNTDYILVKEESFARAAALLREQGYSVL